MKVTCDVLWNHLLPINEGILKSTILVENIYDTLNYMCRFIVWSTIDVRIL